MEVIMKRALIAIIAALLVSVGIALYFNQTAIAASAVGGLLVLAPKIVDKIQ